MFLAGSLSFAAARPAAGESAAERGAAFAAVGNGLRQELHSQQLARFFSAAPELGLRLQAALLAGCGALLGAQHPDGAFEWASTELEELSKNVPPASSAVFPGTYYYEIFTSDVSELARALATCRREDAKRRALAADVLAVLGRPNASPIEIHSVGRAAAEGGVGVEAAAARTVGELAEREERSRHAHEAAAAEAREAKRAAAEAAAATARESRLLADEKARRQQYADELAGVKAALATEEETRRQIEAAHVRTMQELRAQEEARWEAERRCQAEVVRCTELEAAARRAEEEMHSRVEAAEAREARAVADAKSASQQYVEAERMRVALDARVKSLEGVKAQIEQQYDLEREACATELGLRQRAEAAFAEAQRALADAQAQAAEATQGAEVAKAALDANTIELAACEERLRVANDGSLDVQMASAAAEEAVKQLKGARADDAARMQRLNTDRAALRQQVDDLEARLASVAATAERQEVESQKQRYELHAQLTEVHRRCEDLQAQATRSELLLQHEREGSMSASDREKQLSAQLDSERRSRQALSQQLAAEAALRQKADASENARGKELQARDREAEVGAQRLQSMQGELHRAREEARLAREALADARAVAAKLERERDAEREDARRERARRGTQHEIEALHAPPAKAATRPAAHTPPSLQQHLRPPDRRGGLEPHTAARGAEAQPPPPAQMLSDALDDELSRSDLWNFSSGAVARSRGPGGGGVPGVGSNGSMSGIGSMSGVGSTGGTGLGGSAGGGGGGVLPRIKSPYNTAAATTMLGATSLPPEAARQLYGASAVAGVGDDADGA